VNDEPPAGGGGGREPFYPRADPWRRAMGRGADLALAMILEVASGAAGPILAAVYLLAADGVAGQSPGKRLAGNRVVVLRRRAPGTFRHSILRNLPFGAAALFGAAPGVPLVMGAAGLLLVAAFEGILALADGARGQRLGDTVAGTQVVDASIPLAEVAPARDRVRLVAADPGAQRRAA
jgi:uncharacterized RDD family membrane protein YckC